MTLEQIEELAALHAVGALEGPDRAVFEQLLRDGEPRALRALRQFQDAAALSGLARVLPRNPSTDLKSKILQRLERSRGSATKPDASSADRPLIASASGALPPGFQFVPGSLTEGWQPLRAPGAFIKLLSFDREKGYAVVLGKLEPRTRYPAHTHTGPEELYMLSGDLKIGDLVLHAGDFHHSDAGTCHPDNYSEQGCTLLAVISSQDVLEQMGVGSLG